MKRQQIDLSEQLDSVPVRNRRVKVRPGDDPDSLIVEVELKYTGLFFLLSKLLNMRERKRFRLDGVGKQVYENIDGKKTFERLIDEFANAHKLTFFEGRALLMQYVRLLMKRGLVVVGVKKT